MKSTVMIIALYTYCASAYVYAKESLRGSSNSHRMISEENNDNDCSVGVTLTCPVSEEMTINNDCLDPFQVITFLYNGGDCSQSDNLKSRHDFTCTDLNSEGPTTDGSESYIVVSSRSGNETYFSGSVATGEEYTLNANEQYDIITANMIITIYDDTEDGIILQRTELRLDCSNPLFLYDKFGASQVTSWKEISGREVAPPETIRTGNIAVTVNNPSSTNSIRLVGMTLLSNIEDMPIDYTSEVKGLDLQPGSEDSLTDHQFNYDLVTRTRYTFFATIIAEPADGDGTEQCNSFYQVECIL